MIGLDVAKGENQVQAFLDKKKTYKKSFKVAHALEGLKNLLKVIPTSVHNDSSPRCILAVSCRSSFKNSGLIILTSKPRIRKAFLK